MRDGLCDAVGCGLDDRSRMDDGGWLESDDGEWSDESDEVRGGRRVSLAAALVVRIEVESKVSFSARRLMREKGMDLLEGRSSGG